MRESDDASGGHEHQGDHPELIYFPVAVDVVIVRVGFPIAVNCVLPIEILNVKVGIF